MSARFSRRGGSRAVQPLRAAEVLLLPLDPVQGLARMGEDLGRLAELDPKVRAASELLDERFSGLADDDREIVGAVLWVYVRDRLQHSGGLSAFRRWIGDGDLLLRTVEAALETAFSAEGLKELARQGGQMAASDSGGAGAEIERARHELEQLAASDSPVVVALVTIGAGSAYLLWVEGYTLDPPHPAPGPGVEPEHPDSHP